MILESHIKQHLRLLNHGDQWSQVHGQNRQTSKKVDRRLLCGERDIVQWAKTYDGQGDLFIGRNPRTQDGEVAEITCVSVDIDPVRDKDTASTLEQLQEAIEAGRSIIKRKEYDHGVLCSSGNGCHVYWCFADSIKNELKAAEQGIKKFERDVRDLVEGWYNVKVDAIYDNPRLVKIIGTTSTKGPVEGRRMAQFLSPINWSRAFNGSVRERVLSYSMAQQRQEPTSIPKTENIDRSKLDFGLALRLKQDGARPDDIREALRQHGYRGRGDDIERIVTKLFQGQRDNFGQGSWGSDSVRGEVKPIDIVSPSTYFDEYKRQLGKRLEKPDPELPTGLPTLDRYTNGLKKGSIWVVGARTGIGKTSLAVSIAENLLSRDKRILFFSTEMSAGDIFNRFISVGSGIPLFKLETGDLDQKHKDEFSTYGERFKKRNLFIHDGAEPSIREVSEAISRVCPDVVIFDHIQRIGHGTDQRYLELSTFIKGLNTMCRQNNCAGIVSSQLNRIAAVDVPALHHLKECGALEEEAHAVVLLSEITKNTQETEQLIRLDLAKNRGPKGQIETRFNKLTTKFEEL